MFEKAAAPLDLANGSTEKKPPLLCLPSSERERKSLRRQRKEKSPKASFFLPQSENYTKSPFEAISITLPMSQAFRPPRAACRFSAP